jgi:hypothetical protein
MENNLPLVLFSYRRLVLPLSSPNPIIDFISPEELRSIGLLRGLSDIQIARAMSQMWDDEFKQEFYNCLGYYPTLKIILSKSHPNINHD